MLTACAEEPDTGQDSSEVTYPNGIVEVDDAVVKSWDWAPGLSVTTCAKDYQACSMWGQPIRDQWPCP